MLVCANALGEKAKLWIIGKSKKPHSFLKYTLDLEQHVTNWSNSKAWMTGEIFVEFLNKLNNKMRPEQKHSIILRQFSISSSDFTEQYKACVLPKELHIKAPGNGLRCDCQS